MFKKALSLLLAAVAVLSLLPTAALADGAGTVYISVSYDGQYIEDRNGDAIAYVPVSMDRLQAVDLEEYGLGEYAYDEDGDGAADVTALQLVIYAHEAIYGGDWNDVTFSGGPGSSYFEGGIFGFDENLNYYHNGCYPLASAGWGATSDQIVLEAGDFLDIASFSSWDFYQDSAYGFHFFADENGAVTHSYTAQAGEPCNVALLLGTKDYEYNSVFNAASDREIFYGTVYDDARGSVSTDGSGCAQLTFPSAGTWYLWADGGYGNEYPTSIVSAPGFAVVEVEAAAEPEEEPREPQDVSGVLGDALRQLAETVTAPTFGTEAGEWTVLSLARGGCFEQENAYFTDYYDRIVKTVDQLAASVDLGGALHTNKSTENSRLIVALSALGIDATAVGKWNLVEAYSANGYDWIKKQGLNGTVWALIALDTNGYVTSDPTLRRQCIDGILAAQHDDGGWALAANTSYASDPDITGMALTALYPYRDETAVAEACEEAFDCLSAMQHDNGTFASGGSESAESCAWVTVACTTWGIDPDTDARFVKNGNSVVDGLLSHYLPETATFEHIVGAGTNAMATDQACYALVAYDRFHKGETALFDCSDVTFRTIVSEDDDTAGGESSDESGGTAAGESMKAFLGMPAEINPGAAFRAVIGVDRWNDAAGYKLIDLIVNVPSNVTLTGITAGTRLSGGELRYHLEASTGKLRVVYFDANNNADLTVSGENFPAELFTLSFEAKGAAAGSNLNISVGGMSVKHGSDAMTVVDTASAAGTVSVVQGISYRAVCLYEGDGVDLIPADKKAVAVSVTGIENGSVLTWSDGTHTVQWKYSPEITQKSGVAAYVALVEKDIAMESFVEPSYFSITSGTADAVSFGDSNGDGVINAQDALAAVDAWLRKGEAPTADALLAMNVNGDSRINTFDALGVVEAFVDGAEFGVVTKAAAATKQ